MKVLCPICDVGTDQRGCRNLWCRREDRGFDVVWAVGVHAGEVRSAIAALKYRGERRWADWLAGLLASYLIDHGGAFDDIDLIVGTPGHTSPSRPVDHVREVMVALERHVGGLWSVDASRPVLVKREPTTPMVALPSAGARRIWAAGELRALLEVTDPARVAGRRVLAVDDVFTDGSTLREVALALRGAGATAVSGLVIARRARTGQPRDREHPW